MKIATISELKKELSELPADQVKEICLRIAKHKKENKELLHYLIYESFNEESFISAIKEEVIDQFDSMNKTNLYWAKKTIRKILRNLNKYIRFSSLKQTEVELRIFFCQQINASGLKIGQSQALVNLYERQITLIKKALSTLEPDLQFDYEGDLAQVEL